MHMHTRSSGALSEDCHLVGVTSEILDFLLHPLESQSLVFQSRVSRGVRSSQSEKSWTKCIGFIKINFRVIVEGFRQETY